MTRAFRHGAISLAAMVAVAGLLAACDGDDGVSPQPPVPLTAEVRAALDEVYQDAFRTYYTYDAVVDHFAPAVPFTEIALTEQSYTAALAGLYTSRSLTPPAPKWNASNVPLYTTVQAACMFAEESEVATAMLFQRVLQLNLPPDMRAAFEAQRTTARSQHWLAFRNCVGGTVSPLSAEVKASVTEALQDEFRAFYTYRRVLNDLGDIAPFNNVAESDWLHVGATANLLVKRDVPVPPSTWSPTDVPGFASRTAACDVAVDAEIENTMMYDRLLLQSLPTDVERVFENLREASLEHHLPAYQSCASTGTAPFEPYVYEAVAELLIGLYWTSYVYDGVVQDLDPDFPFDVVRDAAESQIAAVKNLFTKRSLPPPASQPDPVTHYETFVEACINAFSIESAHIDYLTHNLAKTLPDDVRKVFEMLRTASVEGQRPAFEACMPQ